MDAASIYLTQKNFENQNLYKYVLRKYTIVRIKR